jgi:hypothetical protein
MPGEIRQGMAETAICRSDMPETIELDPFDQQIIAIVRRNNLEPARAIAQRRWACRKVRCCGGCGGCAKGVIVGDVALIDPARLAPSITIHVLIETSHSGLKQEQALAARLRQRSGDRRLERDRAHRFRADGGGASIEAYQRFSDEVLASDENIKGFETLVTLREIVRPDPLRAGLPQ